MDNRPKKRVKFAKVGLFDNLLVEILSIINEWVISFEYNDKRIDVVIELFRKTCTFLDSIQETETFSQLHTTIITQYNQVRVGAQVLQEAPYRIWAKDTLDQK